ncbi:TRAP transporter substrate-binding protein [Aurantimonas sp. MSK8Z-1]|uniref:TRAP transporter substrate-binding protein n=1 Tax=Mangrovibrevibacter kandeliae TaxID=2968473 RepID=UPI00211921E4|nr:TRAP transporter substrate-binding protein [Aurantimonas sp. MSK8Z-1]MCW4114511.1 TRAP transporter substrate-binding protein [Aurantimonas sp. MSK8Z-1]
MKRRDFLTIGAGALAAPVFIRNAFAQTPEVTLKMHHFQGPKAPSQVRMMEPWAKKIADDSNGRIKIDIYPSMSLGGSPGQLFRQAADGIVDIIWVVNGYSPGLFPRTEVFELPTIFTNNIAATNLAMADMFEEYIAPDFEGVKNLFLHVHGGQAIHMVSEPVHTIADTKGKKLRVPGPTGNAVVAAMGATPVTMPVPDLPQALSTHAVDGALIPWEIIPALQLQDFTQYQIEGPDKNRFGTTTFQVSMNEGVWEDLPEDLQEVISNNCGPDWLRQCAAVWRQNDEDGIKKAIDSGNEYIVLTEAEMKTFNDAFEPVIEQWIADHPDLDGRALVDTARQTIAKYS